MGLIETFPSSPQDFYNLLMTHISETTQLGNDDMVAFKNLHCIIHPHYQETGISEDDVEIDLALCTTYEKNPNLPKYKLKIIKDIQEIEGNKVISVSFGTRNTTDIISNSIPDRQAFNTFVKSGWQPTSLESIEDQEASINERPTGHCDHGDSGGSLLYKNSDNTYTLIAVTEAGGYDTTSWTILDPQFIDDAYHQLIKAASTKSEKEDL